jgi:hypothetical protein
VETRRDPEATAVLAEFSRRHGVERDEQIVQPASARESRVERRVDQIPRVAEFLLRVFERQHLREPLRADAGPAREEPLEVERAHADVPCDIAEAGTRR